MDRENFELQRAYGRSALSLFKALGLVAVGVAAVLVAEKTPLGGVEKGGWLYVNLGPEGSRKAMLAFAAGILGLGIFWMVLAFRSLLRLGSALRASRRP